MLLGTIESPADLKALTPDQLEELAADQVEADLEAAADGAVAAPAGDAEPS